MRQYTERCYLPAAAAYRERSADQGAVAKQIVNWHRGLKLHWAMLRFGEMKVETRGERHLFEVQVYLKDLDPQAVQVELYADGIANTSPARQEKTRVRKLIGATKGYVFGAAVPVARSTADYTARATPHFDGAAIPTGRGTNSVATLNVLQPMRGPKPKQPFEFGRSDMLCWGNLNKR